MNPGDCNLKIGEACFYWEDESPMRRRNRLAQREYRKRKRSAARSVPKKSDCEPESPSPNQKCLQSYGTETESTSIVQPAMPVGSLGLYLVEPGQATPDEVLNAGHLQDTTVKAGNARPEEPPAYFSFAKNPVLSHATDLPGGYLGTEKLDFETRVYLWPNEQGLAISYPEACVGPQTPTGSLVGAVDPSTACAPRLSPHVPHVTTDIVESMDNVMGGLHNCSMPSDPFEHAIASPGNLKDRFGRVLNICEAAQYSGIDPMATEYYAVSVPITTYWAPTRSCKKVQNLSQLRANIDMAPWPWDHDRRDTSPPDKPKRIREQILRLAANILTSEIGQPGMAHGNQSATVVPVPANQNNAQTGFECN